MSTIVTYVCDRCGQPAKRVQVFVWGLENQVRRFDACDGCVAAVNAAMQRAVSAPTFSFSKEKVGPKEIGLEQRPLSGYTGKIDADKVDMSTLKPPTGGSNVQRPRNPGRSRA